MLRLFKNFKVFKSEKVKLILTLVSSILLIATLFQFSNQGKVNAQIKEDFYSDFSSTGINPIAPNQEVFVSLYTASDVTEVNLKFSVYKIDKDDLLKYIIYDDEGDQVNEFLNTEDLEKISIFDKTIKRGENQRISLPIQKQGIYYTEIASTSGYKQSKIYIVSRNGTLVTEGEEKMVFWNQDILTGKKITKGKLTTYNFKNKVSKLKEFEPNSQGIIETEFNKDYDMALFEKDGDINIVKINRNSLDNKNDYNFRTLNKVSTSTNYFVFTDRPIYKPGDTVNFKGIFRNNDNGRLSLKKGLVKVKLFQGYSDTPILEKSYSLSEYGSVDGSYKLPEDTPTGNYSLSFQTAEDSNKYSTFFDVEYYRKPSFFLETDTKVTEVIAGDKHTFTIKGTYFSGNPVSNQKVKYKILRRDFSQSSYLSSKNNYQDTYPVYTPDEVIKEGETTLNSAGVGEITYDVNFSAKSNQIIQLEASLDDGSGNPAVSSKRILAYRGLFDIFRRDEYLSSVKTKVQVNLPIILNRNLQGANIGNKDINIAVKRSWWEETDSKFNMREEYLPGFSIRTNNDGQATLSFTPNNVGSYALTLTSNDDRGNTITNELYLYASDENFYLTSDFKERINIKTDKELYPRNGQINVTVSTENSNVDAFVSVFRENVLRYEVISLQGKSKTITLPVLKDDIPNVYINALTFINGTFNTASKEVKVNTDNKKLNINIKSDKEKYAPGENVTLDVEVKDLEGNNAQTEVALWLVDKAIYELSNPQDFNIFNSFWNPRSASTQVISSLESIGKGGGGYGGCFAGGTQILMEDKTTKNIEDIKIGDNVLTKENENSSNLVSGKVTNTFKHTVSGYFIINGDLKVTPEHIVNINGIWRTMDTVNVGDKLINSQGDKVEVTSKEWVKGKFDVYNFTVEKYHTYFANNIYVHNEKGSPARANFRDIAYWNPSLKTDINGKAQVTFKLPDNLTSWTISAVGNTTSSQFGNSKKDIIVGKNIVIVPVLPNILREGDEIKVAALVQNFTDQEQDFEVTLKTENAGALGSPEKVNVNLKPSEIKTVDFKLTVGSPNDNAKFDFKLQSTNNKDNSDQVILNIPIREYGFYTYYSENAVDNINNWKLKKSKNINIDKSSISLGLTPSTFGALPLAFDYLLDYPYGCVEQTSSKLVPALIAKKYPEFFGEITKDRNLDKLINQGITRLDNLNTSYGWSFWNTYNGEKDALITAYTLENILEAKKLGYKINDYEVDLTAKYLGSFTEEESPVDSRTAAANYGLALYGKFDLMKKLNTDQMRTLNPDSLALQVMANYLAGDKNPKTNGYSILINYAIVQDDVAYFEKGADNEFGSRDLSTALALRAFILTGGDLNLAQKFNNYLVTSKENRHYWSNTFGTAQSIKAIVEFSKVTKQENPNYSYQIKLNGNEINSGKVEKINTVINPIKIKYSDIGEESNLEIIKNGNGKLYSNLLFKEFVTDRNFRAKNELISIKREYVNTRGEIYNLGIGDIVEVRFKVKSNVGGSSYAILEDQLPAGLVPVNQKLKNESFNRDLTEAPNVVDSSKGVISDFEYTENGVNLVINDITNEEKTYSYKARVVSEGKFIAPPSFVSFMYSPNNNGNTESIYVETLKERSIDPIKYALYLFSNYGLMVLRIVLLVFLIIAIPTLVTLAILRRNNLTFRGAVQKIVEKLKQILKFRKKE